MIWLFAMTLRLQALKGADERFLGEILREILVASQTEHEPVHPWRMGVVELPPGGPISREDAGDQSSFVPLEDRLSAQGDLHRVSDIV